MDTVERGEVAEAQIDAFISRRDEKRRRDEGDRDEEALWMASVRRYEALKRTQTLWERLRFHEGQMRRHTRTYELIIAGHRREVERCEALLGISETKGAA